MQELIVYAGQLDCYGKCNEVIGHFTGVQITSSQAHRVTDTYGEEVGKTLNEHPSLTPPQKDEVVYVQADGSFLLARKDGWKEVKPGRIFKGSDCIDACEKPCWISNSQYVAHLGGHKKFTEQMEHFIDSYDHTAGKIVFITDGAPWLMNWIEDAYPLSKSVLDFYHACEYLHHFSGVHFKDKTDEKKWVEAQKELLLNSQAKQVIENVQGLGSSKKEAGRLIEYYKGNIDRMDYKAYKKIGCGIIGSGAIESAHRQVIQKRMKQSGQRWSKKGAQHMLNLRVISCNNQWEKIVALTKTEFKRTA